jgi:hypothetical protein
MVKERTSRIVFKEVFQKGKLNQEYFQDLLNNVAIAYLDALLEEDLEVDEERDGKSIEIISEIISFVVELHTQLSFALSDSVQLALGLEKNLSTTQLFGGLGLVFPLIKAHYTGQVPDLSAKVLVEAGVTEDVVKKVYSLLKPFLEADGERTKDLPKSANAVSEHRLGVLNGVDPTLLLDLHHAMQPGKNVDRIPEAIPELGVNDLLARLGAIEVGEGIKDEPNDGDRVLWPDMMSGFVPLSVFHQDIIRTGDTDIPEPWKFGPLQTDGLELSTYVLSQRLNPGTLFAAIDALKRERVVIPPIDQEGYLVSFRVLKAVLSESQDLLKVFERAVFNPSGKEYSLKNRTLDEEGLWNQDFADNPGRPNHISLDRDRSFLELSISAIVEIFSRLLDSDKDFEKVLKDSFPNFLLGDSLVESELKKLISREPPVDIRDGEYLRQQRWRKEFLESIVKAQANTILGGSKSFRQSINDKNMLDFIQQKIFSNKDRFFIFLTYLLGKLFTTKPPNTLGRLFLKKTDYEITIEKRFDYINANFFVDIPNEILVKLDRNDLSPGIVESGLVELLRWYCSGGSRFASGEMLFDLSKIKYLDIEALEHSIAEYLGEDYLKAWAKKVVSSKQKLQILVDLLKDFSRKFILLRKAEVEAMNF